jgi:hypothetical protein
LYAFEYWASTWHPFFSCDKLNYHGVLEEVRNAKLREASELIVANIVFENKTDPIYFIVNMARTKQTKRLDLSAAPTAANSKGGKPQLKGGRKRSPEEQARDPSGSIGTSGRKRSAKKKPKTASDPTDPLEGTTPWTAQLKKEKAKAKAKDNTKEEASKTKDAGDKEVTDNPDNDQVAGKNEEEEEVKEGEEKEEVEEEADSNAEEDKVDDPTYDPSSDVEDEDEGVDPQHNTTGINDDPILETMEDRLMEDRWKAKVAKREERGDRKFAAQVAEVSQYAKDTQARWAAKSAQANAEWAACRGNPVSSSIRSARKKPVAEAVQAMPSTPDQTRRTRSADGSPASSTRSRSKASPRVSPRSRQQKDTVPVSLLPVISKRKPSPNSAKKKKIPPQEKISEASSPSDVSMAGNKSPSPRSTLEKGSPPQEKISEANSPPDVSTAGKKSPPPTSPQEKGSKKIREGLSSSSESDEDSTLSSPSRTTRPPDVSSVPVEEGPEQTSNNEDPNFSMSQEAESEENESEEFFCDAFVSLCKEEERKCFEKILEENQML